MVKILKLVWYSLYMQVIQPFLITSSWESGIQIFEKRSLRRNKRGKAMNFQTNQFFGLDSVIVLWLHVDVISHILPCGLTQRQIGRQTICVHSSGLSTDFNGFQIQRFWPKRAIQRQCHSSIVLLWWKVRNCPIPSLCALWSAASSRISLFAVVFIIHQPYQSPWQPDAAATVLQYLVYHPDDEWWFVFTWYSNQRRQILSHLFFFILFGKLQPGRLSWLWSWEWTRKAALIECCRYSCHSDRSSHLLSYA